MPYAHAVIDAPNGHRFERGDEVDLDAFVVKDDDGTDASPDIVANLYEGGALSDEPYDSSVDEVPAPEIVEIDGVKYVKASDGAKEASDGSLA